MPTRVSSMAWSMSTALCLMTWNVAIGRSNCTRTLAYSTARWWACSMTPSSSAAQGDVGVVDDAPPEGGVVAVGADRLGGSPVEVEPGDAAGEVQVGTGSPWGASIRNVPMPSWVRAGTSTQSARGPVEDDRLEAVQPPLATLALGPGPHPVDRIAVAQLVDRDGAPGGPGGQRAELVVEAEPSGREGGRTRPRTGTARGSGTRPISSSTTTRSTSPMPRPPCSSGTSRPVQPSSTSWVQTCSEVADLVVQHRPHVVAPDSPDQERPGPSPAARPGRR